MSRLPIERFTRLGDDIAPDFSLTIEGKDASKALELFEAVRPLISGVSIEFDEEMSTMFELHVINQPAEAAASAGGFGAPPDWQAVLNSKVFQEGNGIDLFMGYGGVRHFMGRTDVVKWLMNFPGAGPTTFTIKGFDGRHAMATGNQFKVGKKIGKATGATAPKKRKRKTYYDEFDHVIVKRIAEKYGYGVDADPTPRPSGPRVHESGTTDWAFLRKLAQINRFDLSVDYDQKKRQYVVRFKDRKDIGTPEYKFTYNGEDGSLLELSAEFQIKDQPTDVEVLVYDKKRKKIERTVISDATPAESVKLGHTGVGNFQAKKEITVGARVRFAAFGQVFDAISSKPFKSKKDAQRWVENYLREHERELLVVQGKVIGIETLRPRQVHQLAGLSTRLNGLYRFTNVKHDMIPGQPYVCEFTAHKILRTDVARRKATTTTQTVATGTQAAG